MISLPPIHVAGLFRELNAHLLDFLRSLGAEEWNCPTICSQWCVKDIASHLLDGNLRRLSAQRDGYSAPDAPQGFSSYEKLVAYLNALNADWTRATRRLSPRLLIELLETSGADVAELFESADPNAPATFSVAWSGEGESPMWFDIAREYTERWHHQRQMIDAVGRASAIDGRRLYHPVLDTFLRALPHTYRDTTAPDGSVVCVRILGEAGGDWFLYRDTSRWTLGREVPEALSACVILDQAIAWKVFTKRSDSTTALAGYPSIRIEGDSALGEKSLEMVSIMA